MKRRTTKMPKKDELMKRMFKHDDYRHLMQVRALDQEDDKMIIEGKAVTFDEATVLFKMDGVEYKEVIARGSFDETDMDYAFLKYNHTDSIMAMARTKNGTLQIDVRDDGVYIRAELANTTAGRDLYELVKRGDIDKMSFAFTIKEESYDKEERTWTVHKVDRLYDVAAVTVPAYENTQLFARRFGEVEATRKAEVEAEKALERDRMVAKVKLRIKNQYKTKSQEEK
jgi:HK97 family phage prohead protease